MQDRKAPHQQPQRAAIFTPTWLPGFAHQTPFTRWRSPRPVQTPRYTVHNLGVGLPDGIGFRQPPILLQVATCNRAGTRGPEAREVTRRHWTATDWPLRRRHHRLGLGCTARVCSRSFVGGTRLSLVSVFQLDPFLSNKENDCLEPNQRKRGAPAIPVPAFSGPAWSWRCPAAVVTSDSLSADPVAAARCLGLAPSLTLIH